MSENQAALRDDLWLILKNEEQERVFLFEEEGDHVVRVGGGASADFRIAEASPLCFYITRQASQLILVPSYARDLRLNANKIVDVITLPASGVIEFSTHRLDLTVQGFAPDDGSMRDDTTASVELEDETTVLAFNEDLVTSAVVAPIFDQNEEPQTELLRIEADSAAPRQYTSSHQYSKDAETLSAPLHFPASLPEPVPRVGGAILGPYTAHDEDPALVTQIIGSMPDFESMEASANQIGPASAKAERPVIAAQTPQRLEQQGESTDAGLQPLRPSQRILSPKSPSGEPITDKTEGIAFEDFVPHSGSRAAFEKPKQTEQLAAPSAVKKLLDRLGFLAKTRPALTVGGGLAAGLLVAFFVAGMTKVLAGSEATQKAPAPSDPGAVQAVAPSGPVPSQVPQAPEPVAPPAANPPKLLQPEPDPNALATKPEPGDENENENDEASAASAAIERALGHLMAGRESEAAAAYAKLAKQPDSSAEIKRLADMLNLISAPTEPNKSRPAGLPDILR